MLKKVLYGGVVGIGIIAVSYWAVSIVGTRQQSGETLSIDDDDLGGVVMGPHGPTIGRIRRLLADPFGPMTRLGVLPFRLLRRAQTRWRFCNPMCNVNT